MSRRVSDLLRARCGTRSEGWVFPSNCAASGHLRSIDRLFSEAHRQAGLPKELALYCARHDYGTRVLMRTGNLAAVKEESFVQEHYSCWAAFRSSPGTSDRTQDCRSAHGGLPTSVPTDQQSALLLCFGVS